MIQRILPLLALALCLSQPAVVRAQLTMAEYKVFTQLLAEPDSKASLEKRLKLIGDAIERQGNPQGAPVALMQVDLKIARIPAGEGVPFLVKWIDHKSETVKRSATHMLGAYGPEAKSAVPKLQQVMNTDSNWYVRDNAMLALTKIAPTNAEIAAAILERLGAAGANDATKQAVLQALIAMAPVVPKSAVPRIREIQAHRFTQLGVYGHELIGKILVQPRPTIEQLRAMESIDWRDLPDQGYAVFATIAAAGAKAEFAVPLVLGVLDSAPPAYLECVALDTLAKTKTSNPQALTALLDRLSAKDLFIRSRARTALQSIEVKEPASVRVLAGGLRSQNAEIRLEVAQLLRRFDELGHLRPAGRAEIVTPLLETFAELDDSVSPGNLDAYLLLLRRFGTLPAPAAERLVKLYQSEAYFKKFGGYGAQLRGKVLATLANVGVPESGRDLVLTVLQKGPTDPADGGYTYAAAARAAATLAEPKSFVPLLLPGLNVKGQERELYFIDWSGTFNKPTTVRRETIRALAKIGPPAAEALPRLREIAEGKTETPASPEFAVQQEARRAYQTLGGTDLPIPKGLFANASKDMLQLDERLHVKMTLKLRNPRPQDILKHLQQATKLTFALDENIDKNTPVYGSHSSYQISAWHIMRQLAAAPSVQGTWEDFGDSYRLVAKKSVAGVSSPKEAPKAPFPRFRDDTNDPMPDDPRLQKQLVLKLSEPKIQDMLQVIGDATGVSLTVENVDADMPLYYTVNWSTSAWFALRNIAESQHVDGTWAKVGDGYRLRGTQPARPIAAAKAPTAPAIETRIAEPGAATPGAHISLFLGVGLFVTIVLGTVSALALRRWGRSG